MMAHLRLAALLLVPALASAAPKLTTTTSVTVEGQAADFTVDAKLDKCWRKPAKAKAKITVDNGKITNVEVLENADPRSTPCIEKALLAATTTASAGVVATLEIESATVEPQPPKIDLLHKNKRTINVITDRDLSTSLGKFETINRHHDGPGIGIGAGPGAGAGTAPKTPSAKLGPMEGAEVPEIERVLRARTGVFRACYQRELNRTPGLDGSVVVSFTITKGGVVSRATVARSTMKHEAVEKCLTSNVLRLRFPARDAEVGVTYPFMFTRG